MGMVISGYPDSSLVEKNMPANLPINNAIDKSGPIIEYLISESTGRPDGRALC